MRQTKILMGMPITVEIADTQASVGAFEAVFAYFQYIDDKFSTYKTDSEITRINKGEILQDDYSPDMKAVMRLSEQTKRETGGYFDIRRPDGSLDPSGVVKGWSIRRAADILSKWGLKNFFIEAGGDIQVGGKNKKGKTWSVGIRNPFRLHEVIKVLYLDGVGVATSGTYLRGQHIYNPFRPGEPITDIVSLTVIGPDVCEADRFATAAFAMGREGLVFLHDLPNFEGYLIDKNGTATYTSGFEKYAQQHAQLD